MPYRRRAKLTPFVFRPHSPLRSENISYLYQYLSFFEVRPIWCRNCYLRLCMLLPWKKTPTPTPTAHLPERLRHVAGKGQAIIQLEQASLSPYLPATNLEIAQGEWLLLLGPQILAKALFCDLCCGFIEAQSGTTPLRLRSSDVSFHGRSNATYGNTIWEHLTCGARHRSKELVLLVAQSVLSEPLLKLMQENKLIADLELQEKDYLEIAEANLLLKRRPATILDASSDFYLAALEQGFVHSPLFLGAEKTIFWILNDDFKFSDKQAPWLKPKPGQKVTSLYFSHEAPTAYTN